MDATRCAGRCDRDSVLRFRLRSARPLALGTLILSIVLGCGGAGSQPTGEEERRPRRTSGVATPALKVGDVMPPLQAEGWLNGPPPVPGAPGARLLVVDAWGIWCPYCARSAPGLVSVYEKYAPQGVAFVSITNTEQGIVRDFVKRHSVPWPNGYGATPEAIAALGAGSGMPGPAEYEVAPTLYIVGPDARIRWVDGRGRQHHPKPSEWERTVDEAIAEALAAPAKP